MRGFRVPIVLAALLLLVPLAVGLCFERVPAASYGVRTSKWGGGVESRDFLMGIRLGVSGVHQWDFLPRQTHFVHFSERTTHDPRRGKGSPSTGDPVIEDWDEALSIRTKDNNTVTIDVSVPYRIIENHAHLIVAEGLKLAYRERVKSQVRDVLRQELAALGSEELQSTDKRLERARQILLPLKQQLHGFHVEPESILVRRVAFPKQYEQRLQEKQYLNQKAKLDVALTVQAKAEQEVDQIKRQIAAAEVKLTKEWEKRFQENRSDYQVLIQTIESESKVYEARTKAEGDAEQRIAEADGKLAVERALALRDELRNEALSSHGGRILLALDAVANLRIPEVTLNANDPAVPMLLDLERMTRLLVGESSGAP